MFSLITNHNRWDPFAPEASASFCLSRSSISPLIHLYWAEQATCRSKLSHLRSSCPPLPMGIHLKNMRTGPSKHYCEDHLPQRNPPVFSRLSSETFLLVLIFGFGAWIGVFCFSYAVWSKLPLKCLNMHYIQNQYAGRKEEKCHIFLPRCK